MAKAGSEIYHDTSVEWRWQLRAKNGQLLARGAKASRPVGTRSGVGKAVSKSGQTTGVEPGG